MTDDKIRQAQEPLASHNRFSIIYRHGRVLHDRAMKCFGLTGQQMGYLKCIYRNPGISQEELAKIACIDKGSVAKSIKDMVEKGYVIREQNAKDRRAYCLELTERAQEICAAGERYGAEIEKRMTEGLTEEEVRTFQELLEKITDNMARMLEGGDC